MEDKNFLKESRKRLLASKKKLVKQIEELAAQDPSKGPDKITEFSEEADAVEEHERLHDETRLLENHLEEIQAAMSKIEKTPAKYGICENCGEQIDRARLEAYPHARYCLNCEKKLGTQG
ncbi:hypothetical protein GTO10_07020 [Candidatus Saccharibacteria bacterium]|nr:hypothetical protein [Candidatus Saccharibacteria bacterium]